MVGSLGFAVDPVYHTPIVGIAINGHIGYRLITPSGDAIPFGIMPS